MDYIVAGLGNPGEEYAHTRHNMGRMVVTEFVDTHTCTQWRKDTGVRMRISQCAIGEDSDVCCVLPESFMNNSGTPIAAVLRKHPRYSLIVVHDDIDVPEGEIRIAYNKGAGGHNGVDSIIQTIGTKQFIRIRIGIAPVIDGVMCKPTGEGRVSRFVLAPLSKKERELFHRIVLQGVQALDVLITKGVEEAMLQYHTRSPAPQRKSKVADKERRCNTTDNARGVRDCDVSA